MQLLPILVSAQVTINWQNTIGGNDIDAFYSLCRAYDGGFIVAGSSLSDSTGDKTGHNLGNYDWWVFKLDATGQNIDWQRTIGTGGNDGVGIVKQSGDGGYFLAGQSDVGGNGGTDYWLMKVNADGSTAWDHRYGGNLEDYLRTLEPTADGGCILGGFSNSGVSGNKTEANIGLMDYWVVKVDAQGDTLWQQTLGGTGDDFLFDTRPTADGGYILAGRSNSDSSADKSENSLGSWDYWVVKLDQAGNVEWENTIGGSGEDHLLWARQAGDGGVILAGASDSPADGDKIEGAMGFDNWIVKLDPLGSISWQNTIGGDGSDGPGWLELGNGDTIMVAASSNSGISGYKADTCRGGNDYWLLQLDPDGNLVCQATIGGTADDIVYCLMQNEGGWLIGGRSNSDASGEKTENSNGDADNWLVDVTLSACDQTVGLDEASHGDLRVYPNPATDWITVSSHAGFVAQQIMVFDAMGRLVLSLANSSTSSKVLLPLLCLPAGSYVVQVTSGTVVTRSRFAKE